jgi:uncharacterized protein YciI
MNFDRFSVALLIARSDAPPFDPATAAALQDAHLAHLAQLHAAGHLLAAGPLSDERFRGLSILNVEPDEALRLKETDPAVRAGLYSIQTMPWMVPVGAMHFSPARFPRSVAEARAG